MARSKREIPYYYLATTIDLRAAMTWLETYNRSRSATERLLPAVLLLKAAALALRTTPELKASGGTIAPWRAPTCTWGSRSPSGTVA